MKTNRKTFILPETQVKIKNYFCKSVHNNKDFLGLINIINEQQFDKVTPLSLDYITYHAYRNTNKYKMFRIHKKNGEKREILSPNKGLKNIQRTLNIILSSFYTPSIATHGFVRSRSIVTNASKHTNKNYVFNIDLQDFFTSIHQARFWKQLQVPPFNFSSDIASLIAALTCYQYDQATTKHTSKNINSKEINVEVKNFLPQGAPTSPIVSNIICSRLDKKLIQLAKKFNLIYTRYADDITFSSNHNVYQNESEFLKELNQIIKDENFQINRKKTRLQKKNVCQSVTGLVVNNKVNVSKKYVKKLRMLIHIVKKYGINKSKLIYQDHLKEALKNGKKTNVKSKDILRVISGQLEYLCMVKGSSNSTYQSLKNSFESCFKSSFSKYSQFLTLYEIEKFNQHNPSQTVSFLKMFDRTKLLKSTIEPIITNTEYYSFMVDLKKRWKDLFIKNKEHVHPALLSKVYVFFFSTNVKEKTWGSNRLTVGWSSPELNTWINENPNLSPHEFIIDYNSSIKTFSDVMIAFNKEIKVFPVQNSLYDIFFNLFDNGEAFTIRPDCDLASIEILKNANFYIDTQRLKSIFKILRDEIQSQESKLIAIEYDNHIELHLRLADYIELTKNDFIDSYKKARLIQNMISVCDFRIECYRGDSTHEIVDIVGTSSLKKQKIQSFFGTSYILRLYT